MDDGRVSLRSSEPIFPVADVVATVRYYREVLGFQEGWTWGQPPDFGGVRWGKVGAMFALQSGPEAPAGGQWHSFFVEGIDALHDFHRRNGATICSPLELKPWGPREYTVRDLNEHYLGLARADLGDSPDQELVLGDALHLGRYVKEGSIDFVLTSPPYGALLKNTKGAFAYKWKEHSKIASIRNPLPYSEDPRDLGNLSYPDYLEAMGRVMTECYRVMRDGAYAAWVVKDFRALRKQIPYVAFHMHVTECAEEAGYKLWDIQIYDQTKFRPLVCLGYPSRNFYLNIGHSYIMIYRK